MDDKRFYHRLLLETDIEHQNLKEDMVSTGKTKDISAGGICITTEGDPLVNGDTYKLRFTFPGDADDIEVDGRAVWNRHYKAGQVDLFDNGIVFLDPTAEFLHIIEDFSIGAVSED
jgi:hypothetical protein